MVFWIEGVGGEALIGLGSDVDETIERNREGFGGG